MRCPKCRSELKPWPWQDGGYKGVQCDSCGTQWWSDVFADKASAAEKAAVAMVVATMDFPADATTDEDRRAAWERDSG